MLDKIADTLIVPPTMHLDQLVEVDSPELAAAAVVGKGRVHGAWS